jgi:hypothetical protein
VTRYDGTITVDGPGAGSAVSAGFSGARFVAGREVRTTSVAGGAARCVRSGTGGLSGADEAIQTAAAIAPTPAIASASFVQGLISTSTPVR